MGAKMRKMCLLILMALGIATAPAIAQKAEIQKANAKWVEMFTKGDFTGIGALYTTDANAFPPDAAIIKGRSAISEMWKDLAEKVGDPSLTTLEVKRLGPNAAREIGTFKFKTKAQEPEEISGKYVTIWEKRNGAWQISTDIWNSSE